MNKIVFFRNAKGQEPVKELLLSLKSKAAGSKDARFNFEKIMDYLDYLESDGLAIGEPYIKHLEGEIWELRPLRNRILFVALFDDTFYLLHHFVKKTQKTPRSEIEKAKRELAYLLSSLEEANE